MHETDQFTSKLQKANEVILQIQMETISSIQFNWQQKYHSNFFTIGQTTEMNLRHIPISSAAIVRR